MAFKKRLKERIPERRNPGDPEPEPCAPGSIEQELDMCEEGSLKGDDITHSHGRRPPRDTGNPRALDRVVNQSWEMDLSEEDREGDEMSGNDHSSGLEGGEQELESQPDIASGLPGDRTRREDQEARMEGQLLHPEETEIRPLPRRGPRHHHREKKTAARRRPARAKKHATTRKRRRA